VVSRNSTMDHGILVRQWTWPLRVCLWCLVITVGVWGFTVAAQWGWARRGAPETPVEHATAVLNVDLAALAQLHPQVFDPVRLARWIGDALHDTVVDAALLGARTVMNVPASSRKFFNNPRIRNSDDPGGDYVREQIAEAGDQWRMVVVGTRVFATRTAMVASALPLTLLAMAVGAIDGLVARAKRKACAGRESASLYHRAKLGQSFVAIMGYLLCLGLPSLAKPVAILLPLAIGLALLLRLQCACYKKYL
jgi:integrating conjugative element membrane protein (TIGR03747 family)